MRYGLDISPAGDWGEPGQIAELAALAERSGWDAIFCEDYLAYPGGMPTYDVWMTLGLVAQATSHMTLGTMVTPLPRRHPEAVALQAMTLDRLSGGRAVLGVGIGDSKGDLAVTATGAGPLDDARERAQVLEESLDVLVGLWSGDPLTHQGAHFEADDARLVPTPVRRQRVPIWVGGALTKAGPRARALRWDGACLYRVPPPVWEDVTPDDVRSLRDDAHRDDFVICVGGRERRDDLAAERRYVADLEAAGADWWQEFVPPRLSLTEARRRIEAGPIRP
jgi:alkanesulfonate monooxygenase SsuD/methylene tetrahydromethanopterin reductase-like flavin-dependent oxidoreductase (luciferase family)